MHVYLGGLLAPVRQDIDWELSIKLLSRGKITVCMDRQEFCLALVLLLIMEKISSFLDLCNSYPVKINEHCFIQIKLKQGPCRVLIALWATAFISRPLSVCAGSRHWAFWR